MLPQTRDEPKGLVNVAIGRLKRHREFKGLWIPNLHLEGVDGDIGLQQMGMRFGVDAFGI